VWKAVVPVLQWCWFECILVRNAGTSYVGAFWCTEHAASCRNGVGAYEQHAVGARSIRSHGLAYAVENTEPPSCNCIITCTLSDVAACGCGQSFQPSQLRAWCWTASDPWLRLGVACTRHMIYHSVRVALPAGVDVALSAAGP
jgi:hypothetical protein